VIENLVSHLRADAPSTKQRDSKVSIFNHGVFLIAGVALGIESV
jgi:hypothetical protein